LCTMFSRLPLQEEVSSHGPYQWRYIHIDSTPTGACAQPPLGGTLDFSTSQRVSFSRSAAILDFEETPDNPGAARDQRGSLEQGRCCQNAGGTPFYSSCTASAKVCALPDGRPVSTPECTWTASAVADTHPCMEAGTMPECLWTARAAADARRSMDAGTTPRRANLPLVSFSGVTSFVSTMVSPSPEPAVSVSTNMHAGTVGSTLMQAAEGTHRCLDAGSTPRRASLSLVSFGGVNSTVQDEATPEPGVLGARSGTMHEEATPAQRAADVRRSRDAGHTPRWASLPEVTFTSVNIPAPGKEALPQSTPDDVQTLHVGPGHISRKASFFDSAGLQTSGAAGVSMPQLIDQVTPCSAAADNALAVGSPTATPGDAPATDACHMHAGHTPRHACAAATAMTSNTALEQQLMTDELEPLHRHLLCGGSKSGKNVGLWSQTASPPLTASTLLGLAKAGAAGKDLNGELQGPDAPTNAKGAAYTSDPRPDLATLNFHSTHMSAALDAGSSGIGTITSVLPGSNAPVNTPTTTHVTPQVAPPMMCPPFASSTGPYLSAARRGAASAHCLQQHAYRHSLSSRTILPVPSPHPLAVPYSSRLASSAQQRARDARSSGFTSPAGTYYALAEPPSRAPSSSLRQAFVAPFTLPQSGAQDTPSSVPEVEATTRADIFQGFQVFRSHPRYEGVPFSQSVAWFMPLCEDF
jgi:hypothetical protein